MAELTLPNPPAPSLFHRIATGFGLLALLASALFGGNVAGMRERFLGSESPEARPAAVSRGGEASTSPGGTPPATEAPRQSVLRSQPWWQSVGKLEGNGSMTARAFTINADAVQWRVTWTCESGRLLVRAPGQRRPIVDAACPGTNVGYGIQKGNVQS